MKKLIAVTAVLAALITPSFAMASHDTPLVRAACAYRDAVVDFERHVIRSRSFSRYDVRLVDDLEDSTSILRSRARDPFRDDRFACAWRDTSTLHQRVGTALFGASCPTRIDPALIRCWEAVDCAFNDLAKEVACLNRTSHHRFDLNPPVVPTVPRTHILPHDPYTPRTPGAPFGPALPSVPVVPAPSTVIPQVPAPYVPAPSVQLPRTSINHYRSRSFDSPRYGIDRDVQVDRYRGYAAPTSREELRAAMIGAFLTRMMNK